MKMTKDELIKKVLEYLERCEELWYDNINDNAPVATKDADIDEMRQKVERDREAILEAINRLCND